MKAMTLRLPDEVHERLRRQAFEQRTTITALVLAALAEPVDGTVTEVEWQVASSASAAVLPASGEVDAHRLSEACIGATRVERRTVTSTPWGDA